MRFVGKLLVVVGLWSLGACTPSPVGVVDPLPADAPITVVAFPVDPAGVHYEGSVDAMGLLLAGEIADTLRRRGRNAQAAPTPPADSTGIVVRGRITTIDGGSRATRFWVGFGAGGASVAAEGEVVRTDGTQVAPFKAVRSSSGMADMFGGDSPVLVDKCVRAVAEDIAEMVATSHYEQ